LTSPAAGHSFPATNGIVAVPLFAIPFPNIDPVLLSVGPFHIRWYALSYIVGIFVGWWWARRLAGNAKLWGAKGAPLKPGDIDDFVVWATLGIILGGRVGYVLFYDLPRFLESPASIFAIWEGGMSFHGGFLGTMLAMVLFARRRKIPTWSLIDVIAASVPPGILLVRIANFINGELWGKETDLPWGVAFPMAGPEPRHPTQLYEGLLEGAALFLILLYFTHAQKRLRQPAFISGVFAAWYGTTRILIEFVRVPDVQIGYLAGPLTLGMLLSIPLFLAGIGLIVWSLRRTPAAALEK
jgi:phosphatidylglycerol:prolipoprotein diacylglycerol transferase